jgi:hypothetical protein
VGDVLVLALPQQLLPAQVIQAQQLTHADQNLHTNGSYSRFINNLQYRLSKKARFFKGQRLKTFIYKNFLSKRLFGFPERAPGEASGPPGRTFSSSTEKVQ